MKHKLYLDQVRMCALYHSSVVVWAHLLCKLLYCTSATEMMPCLHNYITVDTPAFLANPKNLELIYNMCKKVIILIWTCAKWNTSQFCTAFGCSG